MSASLLKTRKAGEVRSLLSFQRIADLETFGPQILISSGQIAVYRPKASVRTEVLERDIPGCRVLSKVAQWAAGTERGKPTRSEASWRQIA